MFDALDRMKRRVYVVGCFNPATRGLYYFGPSSDAIRSMASKHHREGKDAFMIAKEDQAAGKQFSDLIRPEVVEYLAGSTGREAVVVESPAPEEDSADRNYPRRIRITPFLDLFDDKVDPKSAASGKIVLQRLEKAASSYNALLRMVPELMDEVRRRIRRKLPAIWGEEFNLTEEKMPVGWREAVFNFLLIEDPTVKFAPNWIGGDKFNTSQFEKLAGILTEFKKLVLDEDNELGDFATRFTQLRDSTIQGAKTVQSRLMLSLLQRWLLHKLLECDAEEAMDSGIADKLDKAVRSRNSEDRKFMTKSFGKDKEIIFPMPEVDLDSVVRSEMETKTLKLLSDLLEAIVEGSAEKRSELENNLAAAGVEASRIQSLFSNAQLGILERIANLKHKDGDSESVKAAKSAQVRRVFEKAWSSALRMGYFKSVFGEVVTSETQWVENYVDSYLALYVEARQVASGAGSTLEQAARNDNRLLQKLMGESDKPSEEQQKKFSAHMFFSGLESLLTSVDENVPYEYAGVELFARMRARKLQKGFGGLNAQTGGFDQISNADGLGVAVTELTADEAATDANRLYGEAETTQRKLRVANEEFKKASVKVETAKSAVDAVEEEVKPFIDAETGEMLPLDDEGKRKEIAEKQSALRERKTELSEKQQDLHKLETDLEQKRSDFGNAWNNLSAILFEDPTTESLPKDDQLVDDAAATDLELPSKESVEESARTQLQHANKAVSLIWSIDPSESAQFRRLQDRVGLQELVLSNASKNLKESGKDGFGEPMSRLFELAADLVTYGEENFEEFIKSESLTKYFRSSESLADKYLRLEKHTVEASASLSLFCSEIISMRDLLEQKPADAELVVYNGTAHQFAEWLERCALGGNKGGQLWAKANLDKPEIFLAPLTVHLLETAICNGRPALDPGEAPDPNVAVQAIRSKLSQDGICRPPLILGHSILWDRTKDWTERYQTAISNSRSGGGCPAMVFGGGFRLKEPNRESEVIGAFDDTRSKYPLVRSPAFCFVSYLLSQTSGVSYSRSEYSEPKNLPGIYDINLEQYDNLDDAFRDFLIEPHSSTEPLAAIFWVYMLQAAGMIDNPVFSTRAGQTGYEVFTTTIIPDRLKCDPDGVLSSGIFEEQSLLYSLSKPDKAYVLDKLNKMPTGGSDATRQSFTLKWS